MKWIIDKLKQAIHRFRARKLCLFERNATIDSNDRFEGMNRVARDATVLNTYMGYASYVGNRSFIKNSSIGRYTCIATDVMTIAGSHPTGQFASIHPAFYSTAEQSGFTYVSKDKFHDFNYIDSNKKISVVIGNDVWIGTGVKIVEGVTIGDGAVIATGAIVTKNVQPYAIVGGVPSKVIKYRFDEKTINKLLELKWWEKDHEWIKAHAEMFEDVKELLESKKIIEDSWR